MVNYVVDSVVIVVDIYYGLVVLLLIIVSLFYLGVVKVVI